MNTYEHEARRLKAQRLLTALDKFVRESGRDPIADGEHMANMILLSSKEWWAPLAASAGCKPPSAETITLIARQVRERTRDHMRDAVADSNDDWPIA